MSLKHERRGNENRRPESQRGFQKSSPKVLIRGMLPRRKAGTQTVAGDFGLSTNWPRIKEGGKN